MWLEWGGLRLAVKLGADISREEMKEICGGSSVSYTHCEDAQENLKRDDVDDGFSRLFCHHLTLAFSVQFYFMKNFIFVGSLL